MKKNTKVEDKYSELTTLFKDKTGWNKARVRFFVLFICSMCKLQTVSFVKLSQGFEGKAYQESNLRRIQRFFAGFVIDNHLIANIVFSLLPQKPPYKLSLDRTNWKFGKTDINILMLSICYKGVALPILWTLLPKRGNSNSDERKHLLNQYIELFGTASIDSFMADREFIGGDWFDELIRCQVPFYIRIRGNMKVRVPGKGVKKAFWLFNQLKVNQSLNYNGLVYVGENLVYLSGVKSFIRSENRYDILIIASFNKQDQAFINYKERWQIETMFKAMKTSGFNLEDSHLTDLERISKLIALITVAFVWVYRVGIDKHLNIRKIKIKKHGRRAFSFFKYGLIRIAHAILNYADNEDFKECVKILSCT
ncbi:MAG: IS4 family transposase [Bacillota bacterium]